MGYLVELDRRCLMCNRRASVEVKNDFNTSSGVYCRKHGKSVLKKLESANKARLRRQMSCSVCQNDFSGMFGAKELEDHMRIWHPKQ